MAKPISHPGIRQRAWTAVALLVLVPLASGAAARQRAATGAA